VAYTTEDLQRLIQNPTESLDVEIKRWLVPTTPMGRAKIAKASIALRNNNGGCLIIGFNNNGEPDVDNAPDNAQELFHVDSIQEIVSRHSSQQFPVTVEFVEREGTVYPIICIPSGVESPVAAKSPINDGDGQALVSTDTVYVRTLVANNRVSTAPARWQDWQRLAKICFENREADIGTFLRRNLAGNPEVLQRLFAPPPPTPAETALRLLDDGRERFRLFIEERNIDLPHFGTREAAIVINGDVPHYIANEDFLNQVLLTKPRHSGWTPWLDGRGSRDPNDRPRTSQGGWQGQQVLLDGSILGAHIDFWRIEPAGRFYCLRALEEDMPRAGVLKPEPGKALDFLLQISSVAEIISIGLSFASSMECVPETTTLTYAFRWTQLRGRWLCSLADSRRHFNSRAPAEDADFVGIVEVPMETPPAGIAAYVRTVIDPLFAVFAGANCDARVIEEIANETIERHY
jgi:hypothetical protein